MKWRVAALFAAGIMRGGQVLAALYIAFHSPPEDYAPIVLLVAIVPLVSLSATLGADQFLFRLWVSGESRDAGRGDAFRALRLASLMSVPLVATAVVVACILGYWNLVSFFVLATIAGSAHAVFFNVPAAWFRSARASGRYLGLVGLTFGVSFPLRIALFELGAEPVHAWVIGDLYVAVAAFCAWLIWLRFVAVDRAFSRDGNGYGPNMTVHGSLQWVLGSADRFVLGFVLSDRALGVFGAATQLANAFNALASEVNKSGLHNYASAQPRSVMVRDGLQLFGLWVGALPFVLVVLHVLDGRDYDGVLEIGLALYASLLPIAAYLPLANLLSISRGQGRALRNASLAGAVANVATNVALVGALGPIAAAVSNVAGYLAMLSVLLLFLKRGPLERSSNDG